MAEKNKHAESLFSEVEAGEIFSRYNLVKARMGMRRRWWFIALSAFACAAGFSSLSDVNQGAYRAQATLLYNGNVITDPLETRVSPKPLSLNTIVETLTRGRTLDEVKSTLGLKLTKEQIRSMIDVSANGSNDLITLSVFSDNSDLAVDIANTLASIAVKNSQERYRHAAEEAFDYFTAEKTETENELRQIESSLALLEGNARSNESEGLAAKTAVEKEFAFVENTHAELQREYASLETEFNQLPDQVNTVAKKSTPLDDKLNQMEIALADARTKYGEENPKIKNLEDEINQLKTHLASRSETETHEEVLVPNQLKQAMKVELMQLSAKVDASAKNRDLVAQKRSRLDEKQEQFAQMETEYATLSAVAKDKAHELEMLNETLRAAETASERDNSDISVQEFSKQTVQNVNELAKYLFVMVGAISGAFLGLFLVAWRELTDSKFRTRSEVSAAYSLPVVAQVPELRFLTPANTEDRLQDFARNLGDKIQSICEGTDCKKIGFLSGDSQEGKSVIAFLYARHLKKMGFKTCYVDFTQSENPFMTVGLTSRVTLEEFCKEGATLDQLVIKGKVDSIKAGDGRELLELLQSGKGDELWALLEAQYDKIVIEVPTLISGECGLNLSRKCDVSLFIIGANNVMKSVVDACFREFETVGFSPNGIVFNRVKPAYIDDPLVKQRWKANRRWFG